MSSGRRGVWYSETYDALRAGSIDGTDTRPHDRALSRAQRADYETKNAEGDPKCTLFVGRLPLLITDDAILALVKPHGPVKRLRVVRNSVTGECRGYAFVEFESLRDCSNAYAALNHTTIEGQRLVVDYERARVMVGWIPRRLGGGIGGKKESGQLRFGGRARPFFDPRSQDAASSISRAARREDCWRNVDKSTDSLLSSSK